MIKNATIHSLYFSSLFCRVLEMEKFLEDENGNNTVFGGFHIREPGWDPSTLDPKVQIRLISVNTVYATQAQFADPRST